MYDKKIKLLYAKSIRYLYFCDMGHPLAYKTGHVYYHRHVASLKIGRWLTSSEHVHHIDGNIFNNSPDNLQIMTNEEHASFHRPVFLHSMECKNCGKQFLPSCSRRKFCSLECSQRFKKKFNIPKEELEKIIWEMPMTKISKIYGLAPNIIKKWCIKLGVSRPSARYWQKLAARKLEHSLTGEAQEKSSLSNMY